MPDYYQNFTNAGTTKSPWVDANGKYNPKLDPETKSPRASDLFYGGSRGGAQEAAYRDRLHAGEAANRTAYAPDLSQANAARGLSNESRDLQLGALSRFEDAADGRAPSQAELLAKRATADSIRGGYSMAGAVKGGPGARVAAMRGARMGAAQQAAAGANTAAQIRAQEMATARAGVATQSGAIRGADEAMRGQDLAAADMRQRADLAQRTLNQQGEQFYQGAAANVEQQQLEAALRKQQLDQGHYADKENLKIQRENQGIGQTAKDVIGGVGALTSSIGSLAMLSDERAKTPAQQDAFRRGADAARGDAPSMTSAIDAKQVETQRAGRPEPTFTRHMVSDQPSDDDRKVRETFYKKAGKDADAIIQGMQASLGRGAAVRVPSVNGGEIDNADVIDLDNEPSNEPAPWLTAYMAPEQPQRVASRDITVSDDKAKLAAAFDAGRQMGVEDRDLDAPKKHAEARSAGWRDAKDQVEYYTSLSPADLKKEAEHGDAIAKRMHESRAATWEEGHSAPRGAPLAPRDPNQARHESAEAPPMRGRDPVSFERDAAADPLVHHPLPLPLPPPIQAPPAPAPTRGGVPYGDDRWGMFDAAARPVAKRWRGSTPSDEKTKSKLSPVDDGALEQANRSMDPKVYMYKPDFAARAGQENGETNVGPVAQSMAKSPVAKTAIVKDPETGMLAIDKEKGLKLVMGGIAGLQEQIDEMKKGGRR